MSKSRIHYDVVGVTTMHYGFAVTNFTLQEYNPFRRSIYVYLGNFTWRRENVTIHVWCEDTPAFWKALERRDDLMGDAIRADEIARQAMNYIMNKPVARRYGARVVKDEG